MADSFILRGLDKVATWLVGGGVEHIQQFQLVDASRKQFPYSPLTPSAPASVAVGTSSAAAVASLATRKGLELTNLSTTAYAFLGFNGNAAVLNKGIMIPPLTSWAMDEFSFTTGQVTAISTVALTLAIQEWTL